MKKPLFAILTIASLLITIFVMIATLGHVTLNLIQGDWKACVFPLSLMALLFIISTVHIIHGRLKRSTKRNPRIQYVIHILFSVGLLTLMIYGIHLQMAYSRSILAIFCMSSNALFMLLMTVTNIINLNAAKDSNP